MILSIDEQAKIFAYVFAAGILSGIFYDIIELIRINIRHGRAAVCVEDIIYWIVVIVLLFLFLLDKNYAEIRFFNIAGFFSGMIIYNVMMSPTVMKVLIFASKIFRFLLRLVFEIMATPFRLIWLVIGSPVTAAKNTAEGYFKKVLRLGKVYATINKRKFAAQMRFIRRKKE